MVREDQRWGEKMRSCRHTGSFHIKNIQPLSDHRKILVSDIERIELNTVKRKLNPQKMSLCAAVFDMECKKSRLSRPKECVITSLIMVFSPKFKTVLK